MNDAMTADRYASRSELAFAIVLAMVNAGWTEAQAIAALTNRDNAGGEKVQEMAARAGRRYVERIYAKATRWAGAHPPYAGRDDVARALDAFEARVDEEVKGGRLEGKWAVLRGFAVIARRSGRTTFFASVPMLAEAANASDRTVQRWLPVLVEEGWVIRKRPPVTHAGPDGRPRRDEATTWKLAPRKLSPHPNAGGTTCGRRGDTSHVGHDAFAARGLGKNALRVWETLRAGVAPEDLAAHLGLHRSTVARLLRRLGDRGLDTSSQGDSAQLDEVARAVGTFGRGARLRAEHERARLARRTLVLPLHRRPASGARWRNDPIGRAERRRHAA